MLTACGSDTVDTSIVDNNQLISRENGRANGKAFAKEVYGSKVERVLVQSDSSIKTNCRYGDGWVTAEITLKDGSEHKAKCQTNGSGKGLQGCLSEDDFNSKSYADGKCDKTITSLDKFN